jgi:lipopolysaccharide transport system ATP-binding protein
MRPAIRVDSLSKSYRLGEALNAPYRTLRESLSGSVSAAWRGLGRVGSRLAGRGEVSEEGRDEFWALKDVSFDIQPGEVVGIIGRNGAGKSTLLKILSRITEPTSGRAEVRGRMGSLLEVGTGFHQELTGRENIYLNGSILGMSHREVSRKFDEIVEFSEIGQFLDTPVKRYSSGMYVRLAFAVAAHLETEILLVDEVLAVGDVSFQQKCLGKINAVSQAGRTVVFVSHNMAAVRSLCSHALAMEGGRVVGVGSVEECVARYLQVASNSSGTQITFSRPANKDGGWMKWARLHSNARDPGHIEFGDRLMVEIEFEADITLQRPQIGLIIHAANGENVLNANSHYQQATYLNSPSCRGQIHCDLGAVPLMPGRYSMSLWFGSQLVNTHVAHNAVHFEVHEKDIWGNGKAPPKNVSYLWWPTKFVFRECGELRNAD